jgi:hypothetical protein
MLNLSEISVVVELTIDKLLISGSSVEQFLNLMNSAMRFYTVWFELCLSRMTQLGQNRAVSERSVKFYELFTCV